MKCKNADLVNSKNKWEIHCESKDRPNFVQLLAEFENKLKKKTMEIPSEIRHPKELNDLKSHLNKCISENTFTVIYEFSKFNDTVTLTGYSRVIEKVEESVLAKFKNLDNNIKDRIKTKLDVKIHSNQKEFSVLAYFKPVQIEFGASLFKFNATLETNVKFYKINCALDTATLKNEQAINIWREKINAHIQNYFARFKQTRLKLIDEKGYIRAMEINSLIDANKVNLSFIGKTEIEITGLLDEVEKVLRMYSEKYKLDNTSSSTSVTTAAVAQNKQVGSKSNVAKVQPTKKTDTAPKNAAGCYYYFLIIENYLLDTQVYNIKSYLKFKFFLYTQVF